MNDLLNRIEQTLCKCTMTGGSLELDCEQLLRDCRDELTAKDDQIEWMRERVKELEAANSWIPVSERLPEPDVLVLVWFGKLEHKDSDIKFDTDYVDVCPISGNEFFINFGEDITHWKPITPPTDKG